MDHNLEGEKNVINTVRKRILLVCWNEKTRKENSTMEKSWKYYVILFVLVISVCVTNNINLKADEMIYQNKNILALVQTSNVILFFYLEILVLYKLYNYFKKKFD